MNKNIICDKEHNECIIPKKVLSKLKMLTTVFVITTTAVATFSGCEGLKKEVEQMPDIPTTTYTEQMTESEEKTEIEWSETENEIEDTTKDNTVSENISESLIQSTNKDEGYDKLLKELDNVINQKNFSNEVNQLIVDTFNRLYDNYDSWKDGYKDLPNKTDYIKNNLINIIKNIDEIDFYDENSKQAQTLFNQGCPTAWTESAMEDGVKICIIAKKASEAEPQERHYSIEEFFHEVIHCKQKKLIFESDYFKGNEELEQMYIEGGATFHMKFTNPLTTDIGGMWSIANKNGNYIDYVKDNCVGYLVHLNAYEKLVYLAGYETMDLVEQGKAPVSTIQETITQKYGKQQADKLLNTMTDWFSEYNKSWKGEKVYNLSIELENQFLDLIKQDINKSKTKQEIEKIMKMYEFYKTRNLPQAMDSSDRNITNQVFKINQTDKLIENKAKQMGIKSIETNTEER